MDSSFVDTADDNPARVVADLFRRRFDVLKLRASGFPALPLFGMSPDASVLPDPTELASRLAAAASAAWTLGSDESDEYEEEWEPA